MNFVIFGIGIAFAWFRPRWGLYLVVALVAAFPQYLLDPSAIAGLTVAQEDIPVNYLVFGMSAGLFANHGWRLGQDLFPFMFPVYLFIGVFFATGIFMGNEFKYAVMRFAPLFSYVTVVSTAIIVSTEAELRLFLRFFLWVLALGCLVAVAEYLTGAGISHRGYIQGRSAKGMFDGFVGLSFCAHALLLPQIREKLRISSPHLIGLALIYSGGAILTMNRMTFVCYGLLVAMLSLQVFKQGRLTAGAPILGTLVAASVVYAGSQFDIHPYLLGHFSALEFETGLHRHYEYELARQALEGPLSLLFLGEGAGAHWTRTWFNDWAFGFHNFYLELLWEKGIVGTVLFLLAAANYTIAAFRRHMLMKSAGLMEVTNFIYVTLLLILFMGLTQNRFGSFKHTAIIGVLLGLPYALGRIVQASETPSADDSEGRD